MYTTCITCHDQLGANEEIEIFPVGVRLAFDAARGRLWVVCPHCGRWNLTPLEERWEAIEACERAFRSAHVRVSTGEIGLARLGEGFELIRVGRPIAEEIAAWRYGSRLPAPSARRSMRLARLHAGLLEGLERGARRAGLGRPHWLRLAAEPTMWWRMSQQPERIVHAVEIGGEGRRLVRHRHLTTAELLRPQRSELWKLVVHHEAGVLELSSDRGLHVVGKMLAVLNGSHAPPDRVRSALRRLEDAGDPDSYFARIATLALRTAWGRSPDAPRDLATLPSGISGMEQLALRLTSRSFWARGGLGSAQRTLLHRLSPEDRLALEMAANEDAERRALEGELAALRAAWAEAEEIAAIADTMFDERRAAIARLSSVLLPRGRRGAAPPAPMAPVPGS